MKKIKALTMSISLAQSGGFTITESEIAYGGVMSDPGFGAEYMAKSRAAARHAQRQWRGCRRQIRPHFSGFSQCRQRTTKSDRTAK